MSRERDDVRWLIRGRQRAAVACVLRKPMTSTEICTAARAFSPLIQLRDVWHLLQEMEHRELVSCLNPRLVTGRLYFLSGKGRAAVRTAFGTTIDKPPRNVDWRKYSWVVRAKVRRLTLFGLAEFEDKSGAPQTATGLRKHLRSEHGVGLNPVVRALKDLTKLGLVLQTGTTQERCCKLYCLTPAGRRVLTQLKY